MTDPFSFDPIEVPSLPEEGAPFDPVEGERFLQAASPGPYRRCAASGGRCSCGLIWSVGIDDTIASVYRETEGGRFTPEQQEANARAITWLLNHGQRLVKDSQTVKRIPLLIGCAIVGSILGRELIGWLL